MTEPALASPETRRVRYLFLALAITGAAAFFLFTCQYWVPADPNVDENAYLVGGRMLALHGSPGFTPPDPYSLVGKMWIVTRDGKAYPKYPLGVSLLVAATLKTLGPAVGLRAAYLISPVLMALALLAVFLLVREVAGSFAGLLAEIALALSPVVLLEAIDPDSHATDLFFVAWGMFLLLRWWRLEGFRSAAGAGLLLGYAVIVRYTEGLLLLPIGLVILFRLRQDRKVIAQAAVLLGCWLVPPIFQMVFNLRALHGLTGYGATGESTAFAWAYFAHNWGMTVRQLFTFGLVLALPVGVLGLIFLSARSWRLAAVLWAWLLPNLLLYTAYYYALENDGVNYIRFFLTVFPPVALGAAWLLTWGAQLSNLRRVLQPLAALALVGLGGVLSLRTTLPLLRSDHAERLGAAAADREVLAHAPAGSVVFGPQEALMALQFVGDYRLYGRNVFSRRGIDELAKIRPGEPNPLQPERARALYDRLKGYGNRDLALLQRGLAVRALDGGQRVFVIAPAAAGAAWLRFVRAELDASDGRSLEARQVAGWSDPAAPAAQWQLLEVAVRR